MTNTNKGTGIVCEYNPFHKGHAYQIQKVKEMGARFVVCAMSGDFTQRGEAAFQDKKVRAENAVNNGADIVLEIPFPFSSMSAEGFARAGIHILEGCGLCDSFAFGSECADIDKLLCVAALLDESFHKEVLELQKTNKNLSYAKAREMLVEGRLGAEYAGILISPNDILAIEYLKANKKLFPIAIKRETPRGGRDEHFASSSYIRNNLFADDNRQSALDGLCENNNFDAIFPDNTAFCNHIHLSLMQKSPLELSGICEVSNGSEYSIIKNAKKAENYGELLKLLASKTATDAKIRRMLLFSFFGVAKETAKSVPLYTEVLATSEKGRKMLKEYAGDRNIIVASRAGEIKKDEEALFQYNFSRLASEVLYKCRKQTYKA